MDNRPGLNPRRLVYLMQEAVRRCELDLRGVTVLTEAATGAYVVTPVLAAMAGADVYAVTRTTRYGTVEEVQEATERLAALAGVARGVHVLTAKSLEVVREADIVTNSGHLRPIDGEVVRWMKPTAVVPLMYETWEFRSADVDRAACETRGIPIAGTNERHAAIDVFSFLGVMAVKLLLEAGVGVYRGSILLLCDNDFCPFIQRGLENCGARVEVCGSVSGLCERGRHDAILVAANPQDHPPLSAGEATWIAHQWPGAVVAQFWGDIDRSSFAAAGVPVWPPEAPPPGHMGVLPSAVGPEPIVRLQAGGLKVGEILHRERRAGRSAGEALAILGQTGYGVALGGPSGAIPPADHTEEVAARRPLGGGGGESQPWMRRVRPVNQGGRRVPAGSQLASGTSAAVPGVVRGGGTLDPLPM